VVRHPLFDFEGDYLVSVAEEELGELARAGADLQDESARRCDDRGRDVLEDAAIAEEVLTEGFSRTWTGKASARHGGSRWW
jgi:hypothetical protein